MMQNMAFVANYNNLELKMRALASEDGDIYLPNPEPKGPVRNVLICMEPSLRRWASTREEAIKKIDSGFRNFLYSMEDFILHHGVRKYLCQPGDGYHITDISKGAMLVNQAKSLRKKRYDRWYSLLLEELDLVTTPNANIIAVGSAVSDFLHHKSFKRRFMRIIHYSGQAVSARNRGIIGHEHEFSEFQNTVSYEDLIKTVMYVFKSTRIPSTLCDSTLERLTRYKLTLSRKKLLFNYMLSFQSIRSC